MQHSKLEAAKKAPGMKKSEDAAKKCQQMICITLRMKLKVIFTNDCYEVLLSIPNFIKNKWRSKQYEQFLKKAYNLYTVLRIFHPINVFIIPHHISVLFYIIHIIKLII